MSFLTDRTLATSLTLDDLVHIVITGDTSQNPAGSSYKATLGQIIDLFSGGTDTFITGGTYSNGTLILTNNTGGTINISGFYTGGTDVFVTGGTYNNNTGTATFTNNTGGTFNVTGFYTGGTDVFVTGGTYNNNTGTATFTNNTGGTFNVTGFYTGSTDVFVTGFTYGQNTFNITQSDNSIYSATINQMTGLTINGNLTVTGNTHLQSTTASTLNISTTPSTDTNIPINFLTRDSSTGEVKVRQIPGPTVYGLFSQTGNSAVVSATTVESTLIDGGVGTLTIPANGFSIGDSFRADFGGLASFKNNDTIRIKIKTGSIILADSGTQTMVGATNDVWQLSVNFTIRQLGTAGNASIVTLGVFHTTKQSNASPEGFAFNTVNNTTFDTTVSNTLDVTIQFSSNSALNKIYSDIFVLNKIY